MTTMTNLAAPKRGRMPLVGAYLFIIFLVVTIFLYLTGNWLYARVFVVALVAMEWKARRIAANEAKR